LNAPTDWTSAIAILVAGLVLGAMVVFFFSKRKAKTIGDDRDLVRKDLEAKRDALVARLRDLDDTSLPQERARLERETADVLRQLDAAPKKAGGGGRQAGGGQASGGQAILPVAPSSSPSAGMNPTVKGFFWGAGSFAALAGLFYLVMQVATPRQEGGQLTGNLPNEQQAPPLQAAQQQPNPQIMQLEAMVRSDPNNLQLRNDLAQAYLETDNLPGVFEQTSFVLGKKPGDSRALTFQALVRMSRGEHELAEQMLQQAAKNDPKNLDSWVALAWVYAQQNKMNEAGAMIAEAAKQSPADKERLDQVFRQMQLTATQQQAELPPNHPPIDGGGAPAALTGERSISVTLDLDPSARARTGVLFVIARNPAGGPPAAVKRVQVTQFPITVSLSQADSMMGQPLPDLFRLEARLDADGNAMTKTPNDPSAMQNDVTPGATVRLALK
jgi:tetratricopeptide (TPR) repeat protein